MPSPTTTAVSTSPSRATCSPPSTPIPARRAAGEALRVLRGGGRLFVIESTRRTRVDAAALTTALTNAGFAAVRVLAEANHTIFVEGIKKA